MIKCKVCEQDNNKIQFIKERAYMGTKKLPEEFFRSSEYDYGWDYYAKFDLRKISCQCGYIWYEKIV